MFISIVVAIGTDYGIYFLYRYEEELRLRSIAGRAPSAGRASGRGRACCSAPSRRRARSSC